MKERTAISMRFDENIYAALKAYCEETRSKEVNVIESAILKEPEYKCVGRKKQKKIAFSTRIDSAILETAKALAAAHSITLTEYISFALECYIGRGSAQDS